MNKQIVGSNWETWTPYVKSATATLLGKDITAYVRDDSGKSMYNCILQSYDIIGRK